MIARLRGSLVHHGGNRGILDVNGVGYEVYATSRSLGAWIEAGAPVTVHVSTQVREDAITLYGFDDDAERSTFLALIGVSGVGPKMALAALDALGADGLSAAVGSDDVRSLCRIPGVGKKTAQRLALELKGRIAVSFTPVVTPASRVTPADALPLALAQLGYKKSEIDLALEGLARSGVSSEADTGERLRAALQLLSGNR